MTNLVLFFLISCRCFEKITYAHTHTLGLIMEVYWDRACYSYDLSGVVVCGVFFKHSPNKQSKMATYRYMI